MKRLFLSLAVITLLAFGVQAQEHAAPAPAPEPATTGTADPNNLARGAEKTTHEQVHPTEEHGAEGEAEGGHHERTYFGIPGWILKLVNLILFLGLLAYLLAKPIKKALLDRKDAIRNQLAEAEARRKKSDQLAADIQARLDQIEGEVSSILQRAKDEGERQKQEILRAADAEAQKIMAAANNEVDARVKAAREELTHYAKELATARAHEILKTSLTDEDRRRLFAENVEKIAEVQK